MTQTFSFASSSSFGIGLFYTLIHHFVHYHSYTTELARHGWQMGIGTRFSFCYCRNFGTKGRKEGRKEGRKVGGNLGLARLDPTRPTGSERVFRALV